MPRLLLTFAYWIRRLRRGQSGNVTIMFAFSLLPMIGLVGLGVDYGMALSAKSKLDNAADTAAIAAVATAKLYVANHQGEANLTANAIAAGTDRATRAFAVNAGSVPFTTTPTPNIGLTFAGRTFSSTVTYKTVTKNNFGQIFQQSSTAVGGATAASADIPSYLDFYLLIDVSGSMGLPSTLDGQNYLAANNGNCQFACHFPGTDGSGYAFATKNSIQLRSGAVNTAVCGLLTLAGQPLVPNQYRVGLYPFITQMGTLAPITSTISSLRLAATCDATPPTAFTALLDTGRTQLNNNNDPTSGDGSGGTHFDSSLTTIQSTIKPYGDGSSISNSRPFVFLITDGMQNTQYFGQTQYGTIAYPGSPSQFTGYKAGGWTGGSNPSTIDPSLCNALKTAGATISILYIPYTTLTVTSQNTAETQQANKAITTLPTKLQSCASSGYFYTANTPADINNALGAMFAQAVQMAHLLK